jgi:hypothetical protein
MGKKFVNGKHKSHRENLLFEREKSLFPQTQALIVTENRLDELHKLREDATKAWRKAKGKDKDRLRDLYISIENAVITIGSGEKAKGKKKFTRKCPTGGCQGFLSTAWKCGLCKKNICKECNEVKTPGHTCDPGNVETVKLLARDTKPCPKCGEMIFKASGCSQMWCTACHCVFDWNTMEIDTGVVHNPHYYEYHRRHGTLQRQPGDVPCDIVLPSIYKISTSLRDQDYVFRTHRLAGHLLYANRNILVPGDVNLENRKKFMRNHITENQFKLRIQKNEKHREKLQEIRNIRDMCGNVLRDIFIQDRDRGLEFPEFKLMVDNLVNYTNENLRKVKILYDNCVMEFIDPVSLEMVSDSAKRKE